MSQDAHPGDDANGSADSAFSSRGGLLAILSRVGSSTEGLREILSSHPEGLIAFVPERQIMCANARAEALFGYGPGQLDGLSTDCLIPARLRQPNAAPLAAAVDLMQVELPGLMQDGTEVPIEWCFGSARRAGQVIFVMTVRDRRVVDRSVQELRDSDERFQLFVNGVRDCAIYMLDADGRVTSWNEGAERIKGWSAQDILGRSYDVFFTPEDRATGLPAQLLADAREEGSHQTMGWRVRKDGSRFWVQGSLTVLRDANGMVRGYAKLTRDLTERLRAEENERRLIAEQAAREAAQEGERRVRASEDRLRRLQRVTAALSEAVTPEDVSVAVLRECTDAAGATGAALFLLSPDERILQLLGQRGDSEDFAANYGSIPLESHTPVTDAGRERQPAFFEDFEAIARHYPALREAAGVGRFEASAALPLVAHGILLGVLGVRFDQGRAFDENDRTLLLTMSDLCAQALERARLFAAEREARAIAEAASRSKDEFLAMLGHELRNPLAPISTAVQLMKLRGDGHAHRERDLIERQVAHLNTLVDDLLDVSRVARGLVSLSRTPTAVAEILSTAVEMASPLLEQRQHKLDVVAPENGLSIDADPLRMAQVVSNLLTNAAKYTPPGGHVWLSATLEDGQAVIRVRDDGSGIGPDLLPRVFDLFVQGERTMARSEGGLGLGLALVKSLVGLHGGTVSASSQGTGHGSEFVVRVAALSIAAQRAVAAPPVVRRGVKPGKRILVVDDNEDACEILAEALREEGHEVEVAHDGPSALGKLAGFVADVAILDLGLPVMDGFELARRMADRGPARPRLIALTGYGREGDFAKTLAAGFDAHLVKPVDLAVLASKIDPGPNAT